MYYKYGILQACRLAQHCFKNLVFKNKPWNSFSWNCVRAWTSWQATARRREKNKKLFHAAQEMELRHKRVINRKIKMSPVSKFYYNPPYFQHSILTYSSRASHKQEQQDLSRFDSLSGRQHSSPIFVINLRPLIM